MSNPTSSDAIQGCCTTEDMIAIAGEDIASALSDFRVIDDGADAHGEINIRAATL